MHTATHDGLRTRQTLLQKLKDYDNAVSWQEFMDMYWNMVYSVALRSRLNHQDAEDLAMEVMAEVARKMPEFKYDPKRGSFRGWLLTLTRWRIKDRQRRRNPAEPAEEHTVADESSTSPIERMPAPDAPEWEPAADREYLQQVLKRAMDRVRERAKPLHFQVFDYCARQEWPAAKVSAMLGVSRLHIHLINHRIRGALKREVRRIEKEMAAREKSIVDGKLPPSALR
jgi:RNA polymerase sigma-70 factor (ECF subfamily)